MTRILRWRQGRYAIYQDADQPLPWLLRWPGRSMAFRTSGELMPILGEVLTNPAARDVERYAKPARSQAVKASERTAEGGAQRA